MLPECVLTETSALNIRSCLLIIWCNIGSLYIVQTVKEKTAAMESIFTSYFWMQDILDATIFSKYTQVDVIFSHSGWSYGGNGDQTIMYLKLVLRVSL